MTHYFKQASSSSSGAAHSPVLWGYTPSFRQHYCRPWCGLEPAHPQTVPPMSHFRSLLTASGVECAIIAGLQVARRVFGKLIHSVTQLHYI